MTDASGSPQPRRARISRTLCALLFLVFVVEAAGSLLPGGLLAAPVAPAAPSAAPSNAGPAFDLFQSAYKAFIQSRWKDAVGLLEKSVHLNPVNADSQYLLGLAYYQLFQFEKAEKAFLEVVRLEQRSYRGYLQLANAALARGQYEQARKYARSILDFDRKSFMAWYCLAVIDYKAGRLGDAIHNWNQSRAYWDDHAPTHFNLGVALYNQRRPKEAIQRLRRATVMEPKKPIYSFMLGWVSYMSNDMSTAFIALNKAITEDKTLAYGPTAQALLAMRQRRFDEAAKSVHLAITRDPEMGKAYILKALLLVQANKRDEAVKALQEALAIDPLDVDARDALLRLGITPPPPGPARLPRAIPSPVPGGSPLASPSAKPGGPGGEPTWGPSRAPATPRPRSSPSSRPVVPPGVPVPR